MPICSTVQSNETGAGTQVSGEVCDDSGGGGNDYNVEAMLTIDAAQVDFTACTPAPHKQVTSKGHHQVWWKLKLTPNGKIPFTVELKCKPDATGITPVALCICSERAAPPNRQFFLATTHMLEHHCAPEP